MTQTSPRASAGKGIALRLDGLSKAYGSVRAINDLSFSVDEGRFFVLFGPSSVGKTTTLRTIAGLVQADSGTLEIGGRDMTHAPIAGRGISMVFQSFALYPHLTVYDNLAYPLREEKAARAEIDKRVKETAEILRLTHRLKAKPATLSGGEQQRVALGRSLIRRPKILLLDEPLTNLDAKLRHETRAELKRLHRQFGMTVIYATPDELEALSMGEAIAVMRDGGIVQIGTPDELYEQPTHTYVASKIGSPHMNLFTASVRADTRSFDTPLGTLVPATAPKTADAGEAALIGIRPSDIRLAAKGEAGVASKVHLVEPLGDITIVSVVAGGEMLRMVLPEAIAASIRTGDSASIAIDNRKIHVFRAASGQAMT
ncbi:sugar ABC transporter ATP-binding protein [Mesorhizobium sp. SEMIA 3007]|uniref:ABC transporter ATP-binding protein n=1 Tax=Mesorhizobium jarvisii TaxID=1777867 RepID=A0A6M7TBF7_9HYPH|nr:MULTISPECIES: ABC transporter ATP-binding protein [Mesorhizobium]AID32605.2 ATP-binding cassette domain-containing protein [Mesorhizobium huakuii 7653R]ANN56809.1 sugar ABC transporter ATP-binding protein [Mesorhizobium loti NZP2037]MCH4554951.1 ABC transporter ATP-binding protein [Mesorhizobium jarvisii]MCH4557511.1 ABC transporter ATP-binding protein [Mesorhizobium jarvisii]OBQ76267.1 sugar ABC transporter ATP-binding protein [Mesorhizobium loti]